jgi:hypothetical protein
MGRVSAVVAAIIREVIAREELPRDPVSAPVARRSGAAFSRFAPEPLPSDLPPADAGGEGGRGFASLLFAPDELPPDLPSTSLVSGRWLSWLFKPERLDP